MKVGSKQCTLEGLSLEAMGLVLKKSAFLASKLRDGPLLEHGPLIDFLHFYLHLYENLLN